jgi:hypothetical protein
LENGPKNRTATKPVPSREARGKRKEKKRKKQD